MTDGPPPTAPGQPTDDLPPGVPATRPAAPPAGPIVAHLAEQQAVEMVLAVVQLDLRRGRSGQPYLALELRDRSGTIPARVFRDASAVAARVRVGDAVRVRGRVERYRDRLQLDVQQLMPADGADPSALLPTAYRDLDELEGFLEHLAAEVHDAGFSALLGALLGDAELRAALRRAPCSRGGHHAYLGGLIEHTVAVAQLAWELCELHPRLDRDLLITAAIVHDLGKLREFTYAAAIELSEPGRLLGHVELGLQLLTEYRPAELADARWLALCHCVLTHHGPEQTPTRSFQSYEAVALHRVNAVDAHLKFAFEHGLG